MPLEPADRDAALLLDMLLAARDALDFATGLDEAAFMASRLHQSAVIRLPALIAQLLPLVPPDDGNGEQTPL